MAVACYSGVILTKKSNLDITDGLPSSSSSPSSPMLSPSSPYPFSFSSGESTSSHIHMKHSSSGSLHKGNGPFGSIRSQASSSASSPTCSVLLPSPALSSSFLLHSPASPFSHEFKNLRFASSSSSPPTSSSTCPSTTNSSANNSCARLPLVPTSLASISSSDSFLSFSSDSTYYPQSPTAGCQELPPLPSPTDSFASRRRGIAGSCFIEEGLFGEDTAAQYSAHGQRVLEVGDPVIPAAPAKSLRKKSSMFFSSSSTSGSGEMETRPPLLKTRTPSSSNLFRVRQQLKRNTSAKEEECVRDGTAPYRSTYISSPSYVSADPKLYPVNSGAFFSHRPLSVIKDDASSAAQAPQSHAHHDTCPTLGPLGFNLGEDASNLDDWFISYSP